MTPSNPCCEKCHPSFAHDGCVLNPPCPCHSSLKIGDSLVIDHVHESLGKESAKRVVRVLRTFGIEDHLPAIGHLVELELSHQTEELRKKVEALTNDCCDEACDRDVDFNNARQKVLELLTPNP